MKNSRYIIVLLIIQFLFSCSSKQKEIKLTSISLQNEGMVEIYLEVGEKKYKIETIQGMGPNNIERDKFSDYDIPNDAISAIQNYWSGVQKVYYVKEDKNTKLLSVRLAKVYEGGKIKYNYIELNAINPDEAIDNSNHVEGTFKFIELIEEGETVGLKFERHGEIVEVWDMPEELWYKYDWNPLRGNSPVLGKQFNVHIDKKTMYMSKCSILR